MAEVKHNFEGIARFNANLIFGALASNPKFAFLTKGFIGKVVFKLLEVFGNWLANQGLALANVGYDAIVIAVEKVNFEHVFDQAIYDLLKDQNTLSPEERKHIDEKVKNAFRDFGPFT